MDVKVEVISSDKETVRRRQEIPFRKSCNERLLASRSFDTEVYATSLSFCIVGAAKDTMHGRAYPFPYSLCFVLSR